MDRDALTERSINLLLFGRDGGGADRGTTGTRWTIFPFGILGARRHRRIPEGRRSTFVRPRSSFEWIVCVVLFEVGTSATFAPAPQCDTTPNLHSHFLAFPSHLSDRLILPLASPVDRSRFPSILFFQRRSGKIFQKSNVELSVNRLWYRVELPLGCIT